MNLVVAQTIDPVSLYLDHLAVCSRHTRITQNSTYTYAWVWDTENELV